MKKRNKIALDLFTKKYRKRIVKPKKGKGSFKRRKKYFSLVEHQSFELFLRTYLYLYLSFL